MYGQSPYGRLPYDRPQIIAAAAGPTLILMAQILLSLLLMVFL